VLCAGPGERRLRELDARARDRPGEAQRRALEPQLEDLLGRDRRGLRARRLDAARPGERSNTALNFGRNEFACDLFERELDALIGGDSA
jgi:hypothetical protein